MMQPTVSIVLTVYNMETCLPACLDSLIAQSFEDFEIIGIDDGSTDSSRGILEDYAAKDNRLKVYSQQNSGPAEARNSGLDKASGAYTMLLDSDDVYDPTMLEKMVDQARSLNADVVVCRSCEFDDVTGVESATAWAVKMDRLPASNPFSAFDMKGCVFYAFMGWPWDKLYRSEFLRTNNFRFPAIKNSEDLFFVYLSLVKAERISVVDEVLIRHRANRRGSVSNSRLRSPLDFYRGIEMLKEELQKDERCYKKLEWGFLNWAFDYACWNIETLPPGEVRTELIAKLFRGEMPAIELDTHAVEYYSLDELALARYRSLEAEYYGKTSKRRGFWGSLAVVCRSLDEQGFGVTAKKALSRMRKI